VHEWVLAPDPGSRELTVIKAAFAESLMIGLNVAFEGRVTF